MGFPLLFSQISVSLLKCMRKVWTHPSIQEIWQQLEEMMNVCQFLRMTWRDVHDIVRQEVRVHTVRRLITIKQSPETGRWIHSEFSMYKSKQVKPGFYHYELHCLRSKQTRKQSSKETKRLVHKLRVLIGITNCNRRLRCFRREIHVQSERDYKNL